MSAWSLGADRVRAKDLSNDEATSEIIGRMTRWIPGDILVLFAGAINWISAEPAAPSVPLLLVFLAATPIVVVLAAFSKHDLAKFDLTKAVLATLAFAI